MLCSGVAEEVVEKKMWRNKGCGKKRGMAVTGSQKKHQNEAALLGLDKPFLRKMKNNEKGLKRAKEASELLQYTNS